MDSPRLTTKPRVLVVDDSASLRGALTAALEEGGCDVVGRAMDGGMALRLALSLSPDVVTCDLEMPRMDGFTFLRILAQQQPIPVIVVTSDARPEAALMALDLGARDFVVKPKGGAREIGVLGPTLVAKVHALAAERKKAPTWTPPPEVEPVSGQELVVIGASTGGPSAVRDLLAGLPAGFRTPIVLTQHMPDPFTPAFAARLARVTGLDVRIAADGEPLLPGRVRIAPGSQHVEVARAETGLVLRLIPPSPGERFVPSIDRLFESAARAAGPRALGIVLTGMGRDGAQGARALKDVGAPLWAESAATAVIEGMPSAAAEAHGRAVRLPLDEMAALLSRVVA